VKTARISAEVESGQINLTVVGTPTEAKVRAESSSAIEALERQEPFVNTVLAQHALALLARLFRYGQISHHGGFVDIATSRSVPLAVDPSLWWRVRKRLANRRNGNSV